MGSDGNNGSSPGVPPTCKCRARVVGQARCPLCGMMASPADPTDRRIFALQRAQRAPADMVDDAQM